jgi:hypothetical protein
MSTAINQDFTLPADGFYPIEKAGEYPTAGGDMVQVIDSTSINSMVREFNGEADEYEKKTGARWPGMLIDQEHFKHQMDKETRAYGWLMRLQNRNNVLYGQIKWTGVGQQAVEGGEYRYFSTEYAGKDLIVLNQAAPKRVRPMKLDGLTLTNKPNNVGCLPITNRQQPGNLHGKASAAVLSGANAEQARHDKIKEPIVNFFKAVKGIKDSALTHLGYAHAGNITFSRAWDLAKIHYPAEYAAAHGLVSETPAADDPNDVALAGQQLTEVTNRISMMAGCDLPAAYRFAQQHFPVLCNRLQPHSARVVNRAKLEASPKEVQKFAAKLFNRMVQADQNETGHPFSIVFSRIMNREPIVGKLAAGQLTPGDVLVNHPGVWLRLQAEIE